MEVEGLKHRLAMAIKEEQHADLKESGNGQLGHKLSSGDEHPAGPVKHGKPKQALRAFLLGLYFAACAIRSLINRRTLTIVPILIMAASIHATQWLGVWLYWVSKDWYYAWMAVTKQHFGLLITTGTMWWAPTTVRISGDKSVRGQLRKTDDGRLECEFPERMILIANHQLYADWLYLWWISYTARMHGHLYIILKESLKYIPVLGPGMMFFSFIFLSRNWVTDKPRFAHRLQKLSARHHGPMSGQDDLDPMWLLIFPEGTNLSKNGRNKSKAWADKSGIPDLQHALLPRSTGLHFCLQEMQDTVEWVYDCTMAYEGIPRGQYGQDIFTLKSTYFQGRPPKSVNLHWRRFAVKDIPFDDTEKFSQWLHDRWIEKDELLETYQQTGRFPADDEDQELVNGAMKKDPAREAGYIETVIQLRNPLEPLQIFAPLACLGLLAHLVRRILHMVLGTAHIR